MSKRIVLLGDGTWNDGDESNTNINWLRNNLVNDSVQSQLVFYESGVGDKWYNAKTGGAFGVGLSRNVRKLYRKLIEHYEPGDDVFCYGFSRGAFTVRSLCGFVNLVGKIASDDKLDVFSAYLYYQLHEPNEKDNWFEKRLKPETVGQIAIRQLGVFDTVGSLGIPFEIEQEPEDDNQSILERFRHRIVDWADRAGDRARRPVKGFHDTSLGGHIEEAYHALALDESRAMFAPSLWTNAPGEAYRLDTNGQQVTVAQRVEQVWFPGAHSDVGGGYSEPDNQKLAHIPLYWMVQRAAGAGLQFQTGSVEELRVRTEELTLAPQHDSMTAVFKKLHRGLKRDEILRPVGNDARRDNPTDTVADTPVHNPEWIDVSVRNRVGNTVEIVGEESTIKTVYNPANYQPEIVHS